MRANKSSKNVLRIGGLAIVFMLAVALLVSAISFTRVGAGTKVDGVAEAAYTSEPGTKYLDIPDYTSSIWYMNSHITDEVLDSTPMAFVYTPNTYENVYFKIGGGYGGMDGVSRGSSSASAKPIIVSGTSFEMYAYYRLPSFLADIGAEIDFQLIDSNGNTADMGNVMKTEYVKPSSLTRRISLAYEPGNTSNAGGSPSVVTYSNRYIMLYCGGESSSLSSKMTLENVIILVNVKKVNNKEAYKKLFEQKPVTAAWDGSTQYTVSPLGQYGTFNNMFRTNNNTVGNLGSWGLHGDDAIDSSSNSLTSLRTDGQQYKQFSFLLYDRFFELASADMNGFDLLQAYNGDSKITNGSAKTYARSDYTAAELKELRYPTGIRSITVQPFAHQYNMNTKPFRGLYVTVIYDGLSNPKNDGEEPKPLEIDTAYRVNYANARGISGNALTVFCGGIDYTAPDALNQVEILTESIYNERDGVTYFYTQTIQFKPFLDADDVRGDVKYYYTLYKKVNGEFVAVDGQIDVLLTNVVKKDDKGNVISVGSEFNAITLNNLEKGEYAIRFKAVDTLGTYYTKLVDGKTEEEIEALGLNEVQRSWAAHTAYSDYHQFTIDDSTNPPESWKASVFVGDNVYTGFWTNKEITVFFNTLSSIKDIRYEFSYRELKNGVFVSPQSAWEIFEIVGGKFVLGKDENSPEGYDRVYYFRATYETSNIQYNFSLPVKFDDYADYKPEAARLLDFTSEAYNDLLPLLISLNYKNAAGEIVSDFKGSPMKLYYTITRNGKEGDAKELSLTSNSVYMDLFEGENVSQLTDVIVRFWLVDEAGNKNKENVYTVKLDEAKLHINFKINANAKRYFNNTATVGSNVVSYVLKNNFGEIISSKDIGVAFDAIYDGVNAGARRILVDNVRAVYVDGSVYTSKIVAAYTKVYYNTNGNVITVTPEMESKTERNPENVIGKYIIGTHDVLKARLTLVDSYKFAVTYNGTLKYDMSDFVSAIGTLRVLDIVEGDLADEWRNIMWKGTITLSNLDVGIGLNSSIDSIVIDGALAENYQITNSSGSSSSPRAYVDVAKAKLGKITLVANKVYDGSAKMTTNSSNCKYEIVGLCSNGTILDDVYLEYGEIIIPGKNVGEYKFELSAYTLRGDKLRFYDTSDVTVDASVSITPKTITASVNDVTKSFDNKTAFNVDSYSFNGKITGDELFLVTTTGATSSVNIGTYAGCKVGLALSGADKDNYVLKETETTVTVTVVARAIGGAKIVGIYAVDPDGNYYYIKNIDENNVVIYQKNGSGYTAYGKTSDGKSYSEYVDALPEGAVEWVLDTFAMGGVCVINSHRFELSQEVVYAIEYYEDTALTKKLDIGAIDFTERKYQPVVVDQNGKTFVINATGGTNSSGAYEYTLRIKSFGTESNFTKMTGFNDSTSKKVRILDFTDIKVGNVVYNDKGNVEGKFNVPYNASKYTLQFVHEYSATLVSVEYFMKDANGEWQPVDSAIDAGTYKAKFTVARALNEYIVEQSFVIERIETKIALKDALNTYNAKYGEDFAATVQAIAASFFEYRDKMGMVIGANDIVYEYSFDKDFNEILGSAPVRVGGGICYVRVRYTGNNNFIGSVSEPRTINVTGAKFNLVDIVVSSDEDITLPKVADIIDKDYKSVASDFVIVYRVNVGSDENPSYMYKKITKVSELRGDGRYEYRVYHKSLVASNGFLKIDEGGDYERYILAVSSEGKNYANIVITENLLESVKGGDAFLTVDEELLMPNGLGSISGSWTQADSGYNVLFCILDKSSAASRNNFTNGLRHNKDLFGKEYQANKVYFVTLSEYLFGNTTMNPDKQPQLVGSAKVTMNVAANGAKLVRYSDGEWSEINYVDNGDGSISFETDKLGYFIFADEYVAPKAESNTKIIAIGAGVGGGAVLAAIVIVTVVLIRKKRLI